MVGLTTIFVLYTGAAILFCGNSEWWGWREISFFFSRDILQPWPGIICFVLLFPLALLATAVSWLLLSRRRRLAFLRRQWTWPKLKPWLLFASMLLGWVALFHLEENWRGRRAWEQYRHELEAAGEHLDFAWFIPPPVPDDQNFAMAPIWSVFNQTIKSPPKEEAGDSYSPATTNPVNPLHMTITRDGMLFPALPGEMAKVPFPGGTYFITTNLPPDTTNAHGEYQSPTVGRWMEARLTDLKAWQFYYRLPQDTNRAYVPQTNEFTLADQPQSPAADVLQALSKYAGPLEELRQASQRPYSRFPLNYETNNPFQILLPHYAMLKECSAVLQMRAIAGLNNQENGQALADVKLLLQLAESIQNEPFEPGARIRREIVSIAIQPIWEGLALRLWSNDQLALLDQALTRYDALIDYQRGVRAGLALQLKEIEYLRTRRMDNSLNDMNEDTMWIATLAYRCCPDGWFYQNELGMARAFAGELPTATEMSHRVISPQMAKRFSLGGWQVTGAHATPQNFLVRDLFAHDYHYLAAWAKTQASVAMARIACALERYRQTHGNYPDTLDVLAPGFIAAIPHDIINGEPLHYRRTADGLFVLYSVGWDKKDDGGVPTSRFDLFSRSSGDWVWRYPAVQPAQTGE